MSNNNTKLSSMKDFDTISEYFGVVRRNFADLQDSYYDNYPVEEIKYRLEMFEFSTAALSTMSHILFENVKKSTEM